MITDTKSQKIVLGKKLIQIRHDEESVTERIRDLEWQIENIKDLPNADKIAARHKAMDKLKYIRLERAKIETEIVELG